MSREERLEFLRFIQEQRESKVVAYITGDRSGANAQIASDAVRPMYEHLRALGFEKAPRIDLFLYSQGGGVDVPWRIVTMFRECCEELNVLVPYKAHSAATLISLGADNIIMGKKGELGPIDPILTRTEHQTAVRESMSVEDVMAFIAFLKERAGLGDQAALARSVGILSEQLKPWVLGSIYRTHSHIRLIARKMLTSHNKTLEERQINQVTEALAENIYSHGHAIGREEALDIGLPVQKADKDLDDAMWQLFEAYEEMMALKQPVDVDHMVPEGKDLHEEPVILACVESENQLDVFRGTLRFKHAREMPPQLNLNLNLGFQLPPNLDADKLPQEVQQILQQALQQVQSQAGALIQAELYKQAPIKGTEVRLVNTKWCETTNEGI